MLNLSVTNREIVRRVEVIKKENHEAATISLILQTLRDEIALKADKIEIFQIYDTVAKREDFTAMKNEAENL